MPVNLLGLFACVARIVKAGEHRYSHLGLLLHHKFLDLEVCKDRLNILKMDSHVFKNLECMFWDAWCWKIGLSGLMMR